MHDLAVIIVSTNDAGWLSRCLESVREHAGEILLDLVVADNESSDGTAALVAERFPGARIVACRNRGFGHANNRALLTCDARYVLFLNPDTEILEGTLADLLSFLDRRPDIGLAGVRQLTPAGDLYPTIRRFPNALRALGEAIGAERFPRALAWLNSRLLNPAAYERELECDWFTGAFLLARAEALLGAGIFDERFFMSSEEVDLARRIKRAGWRVVHLPQLTILHHVHAGAPLGERMEAQYALARRQYAEKHFSPLHRASYLSLVKLRYRLRLAAALARGRRGAPGGPRRALRTLRGAEPPPYGPPPMTAVAPRSESPRSLRPA